MFSRPCVLLLGFLAVSSAAIVVRAAGSYPEATTWSPEGTNVALDASIMIGWTMRMDGASVEAAFSLTDGATAWDREAFQWAHSANPPWTSTATPIAPLPPNTSFVVYVSPNATDVSGSYALDQDRDADGGEPTDGLAWGFRTENGTPPRVLQTSPGDGAGNVPVTASVSILFDEPMDEASVEEAFNVAPAASGTLVWGQTGGPTVTFVPSLRWMYGTVYQVVLRGEVAKDANGAPLDGDGDGVGGDDHSFLFTTEADRDPPGVLATTPGPGSANASVSSKIGTRFTEAMNRSSVEAAFSYSDGLTTWNGTAGAFAWTGAIFPDDSVSFNPEANLPFSATIAVCLNGSVARDRTGYFLDGDGDGSGGGDYTSVFSTEARDALRPLVAETAPADGAANVSETTAIRVTFSEAMDRTTAEGAFALADAVRTWTQADGWFSWTPGDEEFRYAPSTNLEFDDEYTLTIGIATKDVNGNPLNGNGLGGPFVAHFRTRPEPDTTPPFVVSTIPSDGWTSVDRRERISITFDDAMDRLQTEFSILLYEETFLEPVPILIGGFAWDAEDHVVSFLPLPGPLGWETAYRVIVGPAATDDAGNAISMPYAFRFTTDAWSGRVVGKVLAGDRPVAEATVRLGNLTTQTGANGTFDFPSAEAGAYDLVVSKTGYVTARRTVTLDHTLATANHTVIDLGEIALSPVEEAPVAAVAGLLLMTVAAILVLGLILRRRRGPPMEYLEDLDEETAEAER